MGENKALMPFLGKALISRIVDRVRPLADELWIVTNEPETLRFLGVPLVTDVLPDSGALGGLYTALKTAHYPNVGVVACDMPFVNTPLLAFQQRLLVQEHVDVVIPHSAAGLEPQHAIYRKKSCLPRVEKALAADLKRMISWFDAVRVRELDAGEIERFDPYGTAFINVNTPAEFAEAEAIARRLEGAG